VHWIGKDFISPVKKRKQIVNDAFKDRTIKNIMDFGSGTLVWADYFSGKLGKIVYAVDTYYDSWTPPKKNNIIYYSDFNECFKEVSSFSCIWACDVFHHIPDDIYNLFIETAVKSTDLIIIKDNDSRHKIKFFINRLYDRIMNGEKTYDVFPDKIAAYLESKGFRTEYYYLPKFCFAHFMVIAQMPKAGA
jgi:hypothetical protein